MLKSPKLQTHEPGLRSWHMLFAALSMSCTCWRGYHLPFAVDRRLRYEPGKFHSLMHNFLVGEELREALSAARLRCAEARGNRAGEMRTACRGQRRETKLTLELRMKGNRAMGATAAGLTPSVAPCAPSEVYCCCWLKSR